MRLPRDLTALQALGFTEIEARAYACLLQESPATGYRISHLIGRPTPNTYKALASLAQKGAVILDDGGSRLCRAVPPEQVLAGIERGFRDEAAQARAVLEALKPSRGDDRVYQLQGVEQTLERARSMLARTRTLALLDVFPGPFERLKEALEAAAPAARVVAKVYAPCSARGVELLLSVDPARVRAAWPGQHLSLSCDGEEHLVALFSEDLAATHQSVWSNSTFLSCMHHNHLANEILLTRELGAVIGAGRTRPPRASGSRAPGLPFQQRLRLTTSGVSGFRTLVERFGPRPPRKRARRKGDRS